MCCNFSDISVIFLSRLSDASDNLFILSSSFVTSLGVSLFVVISLVSELCAGMSNTEVTYFNIFLERDYLTD